MGLLKKPGRRDFLCPYLVFDFGCYEMLGRKGRDQLELFVAGSLDQLVPEDHVLARVDRVLDLGWLREEVADCYCADNGRPGIDPEVAVRLMLAGLLLGIVHDRRLIAGSSGQHRDPVVHRLRVARASADHSSLTRIRQRWGEARFRKISSVGRGLSGCEDRHGRGSARRCLPHTRRCQLGEPCRASCG